MVRLAVVAALLAGCSYGASFDDCAVVCRAPTECPDGFTCGGEGFCRTAGAAGTCASVRGDAGLATDGAPGATCSGAATACATFIPMSDCLAQDGCAYTTSTCRLNTDCSSITTNQQCTNTPGCQTDIPTSTCVEIAGFCHGLDKSACESLHPGECTFAGGCAGTPRACSSFGTDKPACQAQDGCSIN